MSVRSAFAAKLEDSEAAERQVIEIGTIAPIQEAENRIIALVRPSKPVLDICDQRFLCRMARTLGCDWWGCAKK